MLLPLPMFGQLCVGAAEVLGDALGDGLAVAAFAIAKPPIPAPTARLIASISRITGRRNTDSASFAGGDALGSTTGCCES